MYLTFGIEFLHAAGETAPIVAVVGRRIVSPSTIDGTNKWIIVDHVHPMEECFNPRSYNREEKCDILVIMVGPR